MKLDYVITHDHHKSLSTNFVFTYLDTLKFLSVCINHLST